MGHSKKKHHPTVPRDTSKRRDASLLKRGRLPGGARFTARWDEAGQLWSGTLTIGATDRPDQVFNATHTGVFGLLAKLDRKYREWLASTAAAKGGA